MKARALAFASAVILAAGTAGAQEPAPDRSLERMRAVLARTPLRLDAPETQPTFKIEIKAIHPMHEIFEKPLWQLDPVGWQPKSIGINMGFLFNYMSSAKRAHDERVAREGVQRAIADYCAAQPDASTIQICSTSRAIR
jgi:hypothetical protein